MKIKTLKNFFWLFSKQKQIKNWRKRNYNPPSPEFIKHGIIENNNLENSAWIETGTYYGETTKVLSKISKKTISIEADEELYNLAKKTLSHLKNVEIMFGKSEDILNDALLKVSNYKNVCIYLDAHLCHDHIKNTKTFGEEKTGTPIKKELRFIENFLNKFEKMHILIDDIRLFNDQFQNYPKKNYLVEWCKENNFNWDIEQDIFICKKF